MVFVIAGYSVEGWTSISVSPTSPDFTIVKGIRGKNTRVANMDKSSTLKVTVPLTNELNFVFNKIVAFDISTGNGRMNVLLKDNINGEVFESSDAFLTGESERGYMSEVSDRVWTIQCMNSRWSHNSPNWGIKAWFDSL